MNMVQVHTKHQLKYSVKEIAYIIHHIIVFFFRFYFYLQHNDLESNTIVVKENVPGKNARESNRHNDSDRMCVCVCVYLVWPLTHFHYATQDEIAR